MNENRSSLARSLGLGVFLGCAGALALLLLAGCDSKPVPPTAPTKSVKDSLTPPLPIQPVVVMAIQADERKVMSSASLSPSLPPPDALAASSNALASIPARQGVVKRGSIRISWKASPDVSVTGYRAYFSMKGANQWQSADVGKNTQATIRGLEEGADYVFRVAAYDALGIESVPSNTAEATTPFYVGIFNERWSVEAYGAYGKTNVIQATTNLIDWATILTWVGSDKPTNVLQDNWEASWFRVEAR